MGQFVLSPREREKRDKGNSRRDEREGKGRKRKMKESDETEEISTFPLQLEQQALPNYKPVSVGHPGEVRYTTKPSPHPTTPKYGIKHNK